jgi:hypothetical protein
MKPEWISSAYRLTADAREWNLLRDLVVEAGHALHRLPPDEVRLRLGVNGEVLDEVVRAG